MSLNQYFWSASHCSRDSVSDTVNNTAVSKSHEIPVYELLAFTLGGEIKTQSVPGGDTA